MTTAITTSPEFDDLNNEQLLAKVVEEIAALSHCLVTLSKSVAACELRGIDLKGVVPPRLLSDLRKIAQGQIDVGMANRFMTSGRIYNTLKTLPLSDQKKLGETGKVLASIRRGDGYDKIMLDVATMTSEQSRIVFDNGRIRSIEEQITLLEAIARPPETIEVNEVTIRVKLNAELTLTKLQRDQWNRQVEKYGSVAAYLQQTVPHLLKSGR